MLSDTEVALVKQVNHLCAIIGDMKRAIGDTASPVIVLSQTQDILRGVAFQEHVWKMGPDEREAAIRWIKEQPPCY